MLGRISIHELGLVSITKKRHSLLPIIRMTQKVNVPARVRVIRGSQYGINLSAEDSLLTSAIRYSVENGTLSINTIDETLLLAEGSEVVITITAPEMPSFKTGRDFEARTKSVD